MNLQNPSPAQFNPLDLKPLLSVHNLNVVFRKRSLFSEPHVTHAVNNVNLNIGEGETLGLVGESGSGKSTTGRAILRLIPADSGRVLFEGRDILTMRDAELRAVRERAQMVFQDPYSSLDPSARIWKSITEPLIAHGKATSADELRARAETLLQQVELPPGYADRYPYEFSGGQRQRIVIARSLALNPKLIVCDEPVSALDVSTQNQIINLLEDLQQRFGMAYLFIAHDLAVVRHVSKRVAVMYLGRIVESGDVESVYNSPSHPYTKLLLSAIPRIGSRREKMKKAPMRQASEARTTSKGCPFYERCPYALPVCSEVMPEATPLMNGGMVACHLQTDGPVLAGRSLEFL